jgi:hypothetical protein
MAEKEGIEFSLILGPEITGPPRAFSPIFIGLKEAARIPYPSFYGGEF